MMLHNKSQSGVASTCGNASPPIHQSYLSHTLPVTEAAALEEQIAAGHRANLAGLLQPDGRVRKKYIDKQ